MPTCSVAGCSSGLGEYISLYVYPKDPSVLAEWLNRNRQKLKAADSGISGDQKRSSAVVTFCRLISNTSTQNIRVPVKVCTKLLFCLLRQYF